MTWLDVALGCLATWRVTHMLLYEAGPFGLFVRGRAALGVEHDEFGRAVSWRWEITTCIWCLSVWVGVIVAGAIWLWPGVTPWLLAPYAFSAIACLLGKRVN